MLLQNAPHPFYWIVLAMIGRIISQVNNYIEFPCKLTYPFDKLGPCAFAFWPVVLVQHYLFYIWEPILVVGPKLDQYINYEIRGYG